MKKSILTLLVIVATFISTATLAYPYCDTNNNTSNGNPDCQSGQMCDLSGMCSNI